MIGGTKKGRRGVPTFTMIAMMDMLTGALGAVILLFVIVPKQRLGVDGDGNRQIISLFRDAVTGDIWGELPDSIKNTYSIQPNDTLMVVIADYKKLPWNKDTTLVSASVGKGMYSRYTPPPPPPVLPPVKPGDTKCVISASVANITCDPNGTPEDPADDVFSFDILVSGINTGSKGWTATVGGRKLNGSYDQVQKVNGLKIVPAPYTLHVRDPEKTEALYSTQVVSPPVCSEPPKPEGVTSVANIAGRLVLSLEWEADQTNLRKDLDLILEKGSVRCYAGKPKTNFAEWPERQRKERYKTQEYIRWEKDPVPGQYNVYVWNYRQSYGPMKGKVIMEVRDQKRITTFSKVVERTFEYTARRPGIKIGTLTIEADGSASFQAN